MSQEEQLIFEEWSDVSSDESISEDEDYEDQPILKAMREIVRYAPDAANFLYNIAELNLADDEPLANQQVEAPNNQQGLIPGSNHEPAENCVSSSDDTGRVIIHQSSPSPSEVHVEPMEANSRLSADSVAVSLDMLQQEQIPVCHSTARKCSSPEASVNDKLEIVSENGNDIEMAAEFENGEPIEPRADVFALPVLDDEPLYPRAVQFGDQYVGEFSNFLVLPNREALCWLNASLALIVHSNAIQKSIDCNMQSEIEKILSNYWTIVAEVNQNLYGFDKVDALNSLLQIQEDVFEFVQHQQGCKRGVPDSPIFTLQLLFKQNRQLQEKFMLEHAWSLQCKNCKHSARKDTMQSKTIITCNNLKSKFNINQLVDLVTCGKCNSESQERILKFRRLPSVLIFHFVNGLEEGCIEEYDFLHENRSFKVAAVVQYTEVNSIKHFVTWIRNSNNNTWLNTDGLKPGMKTYTMTAPDFTLREVHLLMWEEVAPQFIEMDLLLPQIDVAQNESKMCVTLDESVIIIEDSDSDVKNAASFDGRSPPIDLTKAENDRKPSEIANKPKLTLPKFPGLQMFSTYRAVDPLESSFPKRNENQNISDHAIKDDEDEKTLILEQNVQFVENLVENPVIRPEETENSKNKPREISQLEDELAAAINGVLELRKRIGNCSREDDSVLIFDDKDKEMAEGCSMQDDIEMNEELQPSSPKIQVSPKKRRNRKSNRPLKNVRITEVLPKVGNVECNSQPPETADQKFETENATEKAPGEQDNDDIEKSVNTQVLPPNKELKVAEDNVKRSRRLKEKAVQIIDANEEMEIDAWRRLSSKNQIQTTLDWYNTKTTLKKKAKKTQKKSEVSISKDESPALYKSNKTYLMKSTKEKGEKSKSSIIFDDVDAQNSDKAPALKDKQQPTVHEDQLSENLPEKVENKTDVSPVTKDIPKAAVTSPTEDPKRAVAIKKEKTPIRGYGRTMKTNSEGFLTSKNVNLGKWGVFVTHPTGSTKKPNNKSHSASKEFGNPRARKKVEKSSPDTDTTPPTKIRSFQIICENASKSKADKVPRVADTDGTLNYSPSPRQKQVVHAPKATVSRNKNDAGNNNAGKPKEAEQEKPIEESPFSTGNVYNENVQRGCQPYLQYAHKEPKVYLKNLVNCTTPSSPRRGQSENPHTQAWH